jgi:hypothetical protein
LVRDRWFPTCIGIRAGDGDLAWYDGHVKAGGQKRALICSVLEVLALTCKHFDLIEIDGKRRRKKDSAPPEGGRAVLGQHSCGEVSAFIAGRGARALGARRASAASDYP